MPRKATRPPARPLPGTTARHGKTLVGPHGKTLGGPPGKALTKDAKKQRGGAVSPGKTLAGDGRSSPGKTLAGEARPNTNRASHP